MPAKKSKSSSKNVKSNKKQDKKIIKKAAKKPTKIAKKVASNKSAKTKSAKSTNKKAQLKQKPKNISSNSTKKGKIKKIEAKKVEKKLTTKSKVKIEKKAKSAKAESKSTKSTKKSAQSAKIRKIVEDLTKKSLEKKAQKDKELAIKPEKIKSHNFKVGDYAVYPSHGIGKITDLQKTIVLGTDFSCYLMFFEKEKLTIRVPANNLGKIGLRPLVTKAEMDEVFTILRSGVKKLKGMWSRRAQEYESKINSGNIILLAEVLRDLTRDIEDGERSYSERIIYETAVARLAAEYAAIYKIDFEEAKAKVITTAKDKLGSEEKTQRHDPFDYDSDKENDEEEDGDGDEEDEEDEEEDEDDEDSYDDEDDDAPRKKRKR